MKNTKYLTVILDLDLAIRLKTRAAQENKTQAEIVRDLIQKYVESDSK